MIPTFGIVVPAKLNEAGHTDYFLFGDSAYALRSWLLTPITPEPAPHTPVIMLHTKQYDPL
nr:unnamed protein product [Callosobruchus analis]